MYAPQGHFLRGAYGLNDRSALIVAELKHFEAASLVTMCEGIGYRRKPFAKICDGTVVAVEKILNLVDKYYKSGQLSKCKWNRWPTMGNG